VNANEDWTNVQAVRATFERRRTRTERADRALKAAVERRDAAFPKAEATLDHAAAPFAGSLHGGAVVQSPLLLCPNQQYVHEG
jgi:hypothetical protein